MIRTNFGRNIPLTPHVFYTADSEQGVLENLSWHREHRIRCVGRLHSWIEADDVLLEFRHLNHVVPETGHPSPSVGVEAGCPIKRLLDKLQGAEGWTLPLVGFIKEQTVAGAISTDTHGSSRQSLSHYVSALWIAWYDAVTGSPVIEEINGGDPPAFCPGKCLWKSRAFSTATQQPKSRNLPPASNPVWNFNRPTCLQSFSLSQRFKHCRKWYD